MVFIFSAGLALAGPSEEKAAVKAAQDWLALIDTEKYAESWTESAALFRSAVTAAQWSGQVKGVRVPLGRVMKRTVRSKNYSKSLPGAPDGEYVVIQFETSFENKKNAVETVTPMLDKDGRWRVSGYYIK
ncbi:MAG: hypothetical protein C0402_03025 [Thermodesulfovibrio sp.]|nr:hypothetical protein [Thermodesulfovibrio sp.]